MPIPIVVAGVLEVDENQPGVHRVERVQGILPLMVAIFLLIRRRRNPDVAGTGLGQQDVAFLQVVVAEGDNTLAVHDQAADKAKQ